MRELHMHSSPASSPASSGSLRRRLCALGLAALAGIVVGQANAGSADLDASYGNAGRFLFPMSGYGAGGATGALQPDGKLLVGGWSGVGFGGSYNSSDFAMARFLPQGLNDTAFGDGSGTSTLNLFGFNEEIVDMVHTEAGIYAIGFAYEFNTRHQVLLRFTHAGLPDASFGNNGRILLPLGYYDMLHAMAVQPDGKIVAVGETWSAVAQRDFFIARFLPNGTLDSNSFGNGGKTPIIASYGNDAAFGVAVQPDGKLLVVGEANDGGQSYAAVLRMTSTGGIDYGFATNGFARLYRTGVHLYGRRILQTVEGQIIVGSEGVQMSNAQSGIGLARLNANGQLDTAFNATGSRFDVYAGHSVYYLDGMEMMPTGQIILGGEMLIPNSSFTTLYTARYTEGGALDTGYNNGFAYKFGDIGSSAGNPTSPQFLGVAPDGKVYIAGSNEGNFFALRYQGIPVDLLPGDVEVPGAVGVAPNTQVISQWFTVNGLSAGVRVPITAVNGSYSINGAAATAQQGFVGNGDSIRIVQTSAMGYDTDKTTYLYIGGISPANNRSSIAGARMATSFTTRTMSNPGGGEEF